LIQRIEHIQGYAEKQFIKYFICIKKNPIDPANPKMVEFRKGAQDSVSIKDTFKDKELKFNADAAAEKVKVDQ